MKGLNPGVISKGLFIYLFIKTLLKYGYKIVESALYVYCSLKTVQEQAQSTTGQ